MTKEEFRKNTEKLLKLNNDIILKKMEHFLLSGCEDLSNYEDDFEFPEMFMYAACSDMVDYWEPFNKNNKKSADNIKLFL